MQSDFKNSIRYLLSLVLALAIATAPIAQNYAFAAAPSTPVSITERLKVWATSVTQYFRGETKDGSVDANITVTVVEGNNEAETAGQILDQADGPVIVLHDAQEDQAIVDRISEGPNAANTQFVAVNTPNKRHWKSVVKEHVGNVLEAGRNKMKGLTKSPTFRAIMLSMAGNGTGLGLTVYMTNTTLATGAALTAVVFGMGIFTNMSVRGIEPYAWLLNKGANGITRVANHLAKALGRNSGPNEHVIRKVGMLMAGISVNAIPTALTFLLTQDAIISAGMLFATLRNSWDIPFDVLIHDAYEKGKITYAMKKNLQGAKAFGGPIIDNLAVSNFSINGFPVAQTLAFALAGAGAVSIFASQKVGRAFEAGSVHARTIASKAKETGIRIANSFGGGVRKVHSSAIYAVDRMTPQRRAQIERQRIKAAVDAHVSKCTDLLTGIPNYHAVSQAWVGRHFRAADDVN